MEPSEFITKLIHLNHFDVLHNEADKAIVQEIVLEKYRNLEAVHEFLNKGLVSEGDDGEGSGSDHGQEHGAQAQAGAQAGLEPKALRSRPVIVAVSADGHQLEIPTSSTEEEKYARKHLPILPPLLLKLEREIEQPAKFYPRNKPPPTITLPFHQQDSDVLMNAFISAPSITSGGYLRAFLRGNDPILVPAWLVQLPEEYVSYIREIKETLAIFNVTDPNNPKEVLNTLTNIIRNKMKLIIITKREICDVLRRIPESYGKERGLSFGHFMLTMGNPELAEKKRAFKAVPRKFRCEFTGNGNVENKEAEAFRAGHQSIRQHRYHRHSRHERRSRSGGRHWLSRDRDALVDFLQRFDAQHAGPANTDENGNLIEPERVKREPQPAGGEQAKETATSMSTLREQIFYSGLLVIQMYETLENLKKVLDDSWTPSTRERFIFGEPDQEKWVPARRRRNPSSTPSPYLGTQTLCVPRLQIHVPGGDDKHLRSEKVKTKFMHYTIHASSPSEFKPGSVQGPIKLTENRERIRKALKYLASKGDCLAMLPDIECLLHFGDANVNMGREIYRPRRKEIKLKPIHSRLKTKYEDSADLRWLIHQSRRTYVPAKLAPEYARIGGRVPLSYGKFLREESLRVQDAARFELEERRDKFKLALWKRLDVLGILSGRTRNNFTYACASLMTEPRHLAVLNMQHQHPLHF